MIWKEQNLRINALKFLRLYHLPDMFYPAEILVNTLMTNAKKYYVDRVQAAIKFLMIVLMFAHFGACFMCMIGGSA